MLVCHPTLRCCERDRAASCLRRSRSVLRALDADSAVGDALSTAACSWLAAAPPGTQSLLISEDGASPPCSLPLSRGSCVFHVSGGVADGVNRDGGSLQHSLRASVLSSGWSDKMLRRGWLPDRASLVVLDARALPPAALSSVLDELGVVTTVGSCLLACVGADGGGEGLPASALLSQLVAAAGFRLQSCSPLSDVEPGAGGSLLSAEKVRLGGAHVCALSAQLRRAEQEAGEEGWAD